MRRQCKALAKTTRERCRRAPAPGALVCAIHGAKAPQTAPAAKRRLELAAARSAVVTFGLRLDISPIEALLEEVCWTPATSSGCGSASRRPKRRS